jgi:hypothetical protein
VLDLADVLELIDDRFDDRAFAATAYPSAASSCFSCCLAAVQVDPVMPNSRYF